MKWLILIVTIMIIPDAEAQYLSDMTIINSNKLKPSDVHSLALQEGFTDKAAKTITCIAEKESNFRPRVISKKNFNHTKDYGLLQINSIWLEQCSSNLNDLLHPVINMKCAKLIHSKQGFKAWVAYKKHKKYCNNYKLRS